jgi:hypothetical protein
MECPQLIVVQDNYHTKPWGVNPPVAGRELVGVRQLSSPGAACLEMTEVCVAQSAESDAALINIRL